jgi:hypothetical protein
MLIMKKEKKQDWGLEHAQVCRKMLIIKLQSKHHGENQQATKQNQQSSVHGFPNFHIRHYVHITENTKYVQSQLDSVKN